MRRKRLATKKKRKGQLCSDKPSKDQLDACIHEDVQASSSRPQTVYPVSSFSRLPCMDISGGEDERSVLEPKRLFNMGEQEAPMNSHINEQIYSILRQLVQPGTYDEQLPPIILNDGIIGNRSMTRQKRPIAVERVGESSFGVPLEERLSSSIQYDTQPSFAIPQAVQANNSHSQLPQSTTLDRGCTIKSVARRITRQSAGKMSSDIIQEGPPSLKISKNVLLGSTAQTLQPPTVSLSKSTTQTRGDTATSVVKKKRRVARRREEEQPVSNFHQEDRPSVNVCRDNPSNCVMPQVQPMNIPPRLQQLSMPTEPGDVVQSVMRERRHLSGHEEQGQQSSNVYGEDELNSNALDNNLPDSGVPQLTLHNPRLMHLLHSIHNDDTDNGGRRGRGPTMLHKLWSHGSKRIHVEINKYGQPIGPHASNFGNFLGTIARNGKIAPINYDNWRKIPKTVKDDMWSIIMARFDIDPRCRKWVLTDIAGKWRGWKAALKRNYYKKHDTDEERLAACDERVEPEQWNAIIAFWNSEAAKARSEKNKINRSKQKFGHTAGAKSFARIREEEREKRPGHEELTREEVFMITRLRKDKTPLNDEAKIVIDKIRALLSQEAVGSQVNSSMRDILSQVLGKDRNGRVRTFGLGPCPSEYWAPKKEETKDRIRVVEEKISQMQSLLEHVLAKLNSLQSSATNPTPSKSNETESSVQGVSLLSLFNREVVAQGYIVTKDPCTKVGGMELGNKFWEVVVEVAVMPDEELIRPFEQYKIIGDVEGISIAWPSVLVVEE